VATPTRLSIYNGALRHLGERKLSSLTENREPRRLLDDVWDGGGIEACLEAGQWSWASRTQELTYSAGVVPAFGYLRAFTKPSDMVRLLGIATDERVQIPFTNYENTGPYFFADPDVIYVRYVSDDAAYGNDYSLWPESFTDYVEMHFAVEIAPRLTASESKVEMLERKRRKALSDAASNDSMMGPSQRPPLGNWARSRLASRSGTSRREWR
jgi:hypothetical protein